MPVTAKDILHGFSHLFYPHICSGCGNDIIQQEHFLCLSCLHSLPFTGFETYPGNPVEKNFWGRIEISNAMSLLHFAKDTVLQNLLHQFKYKGKKEIGVFFGKMMGEYIMQSGRFSQIDALVALPLFASREKKRGYNQAAVLCSGISRQMHLPVLENAISRIKATETQTHKSRIARWQNMEGKFILTNSSFLNNKHVLLVDDVITTGATLEACASAMMEATNVKVSIATLAYASV